MLEYIVQKQALKEDVYGRGRIAKKGLHCRMFFCRLRHSRSILGKFKTLLSAILKIKWIQVAFKAPSTGPGQADWTVGLMVHSHCWELGENIFATSESSRE